mgnify:CR=1 FL=1
MSVCVVSLEVTNERVTKAVGDIEALLLETEKHVDIDMDGLVTVASHALSYLDAVLTGLLDERAEIEALRAELNQYQRANQAATDLINEQSTEILRLALDNKTLRLALKDIYSQGRTMEGTALGTQRQERNIWRRMMDTAGRALQAKEDA